MSGIVNLRSARKRAQRAAAKREAEANALRHGRSRAERAQAQAERAKARAHLDGHRREARGLDDGRDPRD